jgi:hypothetical protein
VPACDIWFLRMDACVPLDIFAAGNKHGKVFVYSISGELKGHNRSAANTITSGGAGGSPSTRNTSSGEVTSSSQQSSSSSSSSGGNNNGSSSSSSNAADDKRTQPRPAQIALSHPKCTYTVRQIAFSATGQHMIYSCDNATIWVWSIAATAANS